MEGGPEGQSRPFSRDQANSAPAILRLSDRQRRALRIPRKLSHIINSKSLKHKTPYTLCKGLYSDRTRIRTWDRHIRSVMLYPAELCDHTYFLLWCLKKFRK